MLMRSLYPPVSRLQVLDEGGDSLSDEVRIFHSSLMNFNQIKSYCGCLLLTECALCVLKVSGLTTWLAYSGPAHPFIVC